MSIGLTCFTKLTYTELQFRLNEFAKKYPIIFPDHYYLSTAGVSHPIQKEVSNDFGLDPMSYCYMSVKDESLVISTDEMANMIKQELGADNVIILLNSEELI